MVIYGKVTAIGAGFFGGVPGQLLQIKPMRGAGLTALKDRYYAFVPVGRIQVGNTAICKTDVRYALPPEMGQEVLLMTDPPIDPDGMLLDVQSHQIFAIERDGSLRMYRETRFDSEGNVRAEGPAPVLRQILRAAARERH